MDFRIEDDYVLYVRRHIELKFRVYGLFPFRIRSYKDVPLIPADELFAAARARNPDTGVWKQKIRNGFSTCWAYFYESATMYPAFILERKLLYDIVVALFNAERAETEFVRCQILRVGLKIDLERAHKRLLKSILNGESQNPGIVTIKKLCDGFDISLSEFFTTPEFEELEQEIK